MVTQMTISKLFNFFLNQHETKQYKTFSKIQRFYFLFILYVIYSGF